MDGGGEPAAQSTEDVPAHADRGRHEHEQSGQPLERAGDRCEQYPRSGCSHAADRERGEALACSGDVWAEQAPQQAEAPNRSSSANQPNALAAPPTCLGDPGRSTFARSEAGHRPRCGAAHWPGPATTGRSARPSAAGARPCAPRSGVALGHTPRVAPLGLPTRVLRGSALLTGLGARGEQRLEQPDELVGAEVAGPAKRDGVIRLHGDEERHRLQAEGSDNVR